MNNSSGSFIFPIFKFLGKAFFAFLAFLFFLVFISSFLGNGNKTKPIRETKLSKNQVLSILNQNNKNNSTSVSQSRCWEILKSKKNTCTHYNIPISEINSQSRFRKNNAEPNFRNGEKISTYWNQVYGKLYHSNKNGLKLLKDTLANYAQQNQLSTVEFANYIVSFVQDMPYWYIMEQDVCNEKEFSNAPCISGFKYGLLSPSEIAATAVGDCDSRALLLYSLFRHFNYKAIILVSDEYGHAILGLNIPSSGLYKKIQGIKYYLWETTSTQWESGMLSPNFSNLKYWKLALPTNA